MEVEVRSFEAKANSCLKNCPHQHSHFCTSSSYPADCRAKPQCHAPVSCLLTNCRKMSTLYSVHYSSPCVWCPPHSSLTQLLPDCLLLCWWPLRGLHQYVMLSDAICCKFASWPESYPTKLAIGLHHASGCGQHFLGMMKTTHVYLYANTQTWAAPAALRMLRRHTAWGTAIPHGLHCPPLRRAWRMKETMCMGISYRAVKRSSPLLQPKILIKSSAPSGQAHRVGKCSSNPNIPDLQATASHKAWAPS